MRMKRFLSLMLAIAMLASLTISASAATKLYYELDFDDYNSVEAFTGTLVETSTRSVPGVIAHRDSYASDANVNGNVTWGASNGQGDFVTSDGATVQSSLTAVNGTNWFKFLNTQPTTAQLENNGNGYLYVVPNNSWNYTTNTAETYIVSFDAKVAPPTSVATDTASKSEAIGVMFANPDNSTSTTTSKGFYLTRSDILANDVTLSSYTGKYNSTIKSQTMTNDAAYNLAVGYTYADGKTVPSKTMAINGVVDSAITNDDATSAINTIVGFSWNYNWHLGSSIANLKMYTIDNSGMTVSRIGTGDVDTSTTAVPVKFSQPVYAASFVPANVTASKTNASGTTALTYGTDFTVTGITDVVGNVGEEIYSTATVNFTAPLDGATTYTITFPTAITNEIGTALTAANATVTFETASPDIVVGNKIITKAWGTASAQTVQSFAANDGVYGVSLDIENTTANNKDVAVIYAVYAGGKLEDVVYASDSIAATSTATIGAGVNLSADVTAVKAFIWDGISSLKPSAESTTWTIAE